MLHDADLEHAVARMATNIALMQRALHGGGIWTMRLADIEVPLVRSTDSGSLVLSADFPDVCYLRQSDVVEVLVDGEPIYVKPLAVPVDGAVSITLSLRPEVFSQ